MRLLKNILIVVGALLLADAFAAQPETEVAPLLSQSAVGQAVPANKQLTNKQPRTPSRRKKPKKLEANESDKAGSPVVSSIAKDKPADPKEPADSAVQTLQLKGVRG